MLCQSCGTAEARPSSFAGSSRLRVESPRPKSPSARIRLPTGTGAIGFRSRCSRRGREHPLHRFQGSGP